MSIQLLQSASFPFKFWGIFSLNYFTYHRRHASFLARLQSLAPNPSTAVPAIKSATRSYRLTESTSRDLILTIWNVVDRNLEHTASLVNAFIDLLEEEEKKQDLLASWKGFAIEVGFIIIIFKF